MKRLTDERLCSLVEEHNPDLQLSMPSTYNGNGVSNNGKVSDIYIFFGYLKENAHVKATVQIWGDISEEESIVNLGEIIKIRDRMTEYGLQGKKSDSCDGFLNYTYDIPITNEEDVIQILRYFRRAEGDQK